MKKIGALVLIVGLATMAWFLPAASAGPCVGSAAHSEGRGNIDYADGSKEIHESSTDSCTGYKDGCIGTQTTTHKESQFAGAGDSSGIQSSHSDSSNCDSIV